MFKSRMDELSDSKDYNLQDAADSMIISALSICANSEQQKGLRRKHLKFTGGV